MEGYLYLITNIINNKNYIGKTYDTIHSRWLTHLRESKVLDRPLHRAIRKYGKESFKIELLGSYKEYDLEEAEQEAIAIYNSYHFGYNATLGGDGCRRIDSNKVISSFSKLKTATEVAKSLGIDEGSVRNILKANNISLSNCTSKINQYKAVLIEDVSLEFPSVMKCAEFLIQCEVVENKNPTTVRIGISKVLTGARKSYAGLKFKYIS